ncbi:hypothetical protein BKA62DRAFT_438542 [Auriculariales sp. MPI-PUGE-AT-0066]|nr:hypothetical protein BKA62DRAFT_438542 [Auriculariales sp. MPI-PUGE-AT-0066]
MASLFRVDKLDKQILLRVPRPNTLKRGTIAVLPYWQLAGKTLCLQVISPNDGLSLDPSVIAIKLLYGSLQVWTESGWEDRGISPLPKTAASTEVTSGATVRAGSDGVVFMSVARGSDGFEGPFSSMDQIESKPIIVDGAFLDPTLPDVDIPFVRVDETSWGSTGHWDGLQFFNATGFSIYFGDDSMELICHTQAWTCGLYETAKFHIHDRINFGEIHMTLNNGGGSSGMRYFPDDYERPTNFDDLELDKDYVEANTKLLVIPDLHEQGAFWKIQPGHHFKPVITAGDMVDYPLHSWVGSQFGARGKPPIIPSLKKEEQRYDVWIAFELPSTRFQF